MIAELPDSQLDKPFQLTQQTLMPPGKSVTTQIQVSLCSSLLWLLVLMANPWSMTLTHAAVNLRYYDTDRDGLISPAEYREFLLRQLRIPMSVLDRDGNDEISPEEIEALAKLLQSTNERVDSYEIDAPGGLDLYAFAEQEGLREETQEPPASWLERRGILVV
ncbi:hypothetical protein [Granulosicoccus antarcticus]|uniref:hypothetical protein n=1 Tax=Granulosicoccus antarcticus TaxID=437505 RepID=UPI0012FE03E9|nr:hypothetical protein [Granulosicoccus antarcticus]